MPLPTLIKSGFSILLGDSIIENTDKAFSILQQHFTFRADEISKAYQDSYGYSITAITVGLAAPEQKLLFVQKFLHSKITRDFADSIEDNYFQPFLQQQTNKGKDLRKQFITELNKLIKYKDQLFQFNQFEEQDLAALINSQGSVAITDLVLEEIKQFATVDETLAAFLCQQDLLGKAILYFFHDIIRQDDRVAKIQAALQREGLIISTQNIETGIKEILQRLRFVEQHQGISAQIKARDEFTIHNNTSLKLIEEAVSLLKKLPKQNPEYSRISIRVGSALSSTGDLEKSELLLKQAIENTENNSVKALAHFDLFQIYLRRQTYEPALAELQTAIELDSERYALHDINKGYYPIERLLGAGGMGCVLLCKNENNLIEQERVVVKCFWETLKSDIKNVFKEPFAMSKIAGEFVPKPLDFGYANNAKGERAYFVTEYIEGAIDGEAWLEKNGPMDLETTLEVGLQVAKGLQLAHDNGIYHLDLKPANLLLKRTESGIDLKIIDFGLSQVATSLSELGKQKSQSGLSVFGQAVLGGTLDYSPPEQQSFARHCKPDAKNDVFAFGTTMYRLCTQNSPRFFRERDLPDVQALRDLLYDCVEAEREKRPDSARELVSKLEEIAGKSEAQKQVKWLDGVANFFKVQKEKIRQAKIAKQKAEEEQKRLKAEEERKRLKAEEERKRLKAEEERKRLKAEEERKRQAEIAKQKAEQEEQKKGKLFEFEIVTVNSKGKITNREQKQARYQAIDIGNGVILEMVYIPAGTFMMGSPENKVTIKFFYMSKYPITQAQWQAIMGNNPSRFKGDNRPVEKVSWHDAVAFCKKLSEKTSQTYNLPSEAQWEYACRAGTTTPFYFGETITTDLANYDGNYTYGSGPKGIYREKTTDVGSFPPNAFGLYDMHGNVWEICADPWHDNYEGAPSDGNFWAENPEKSSRFVLRGGSWDNEPRGVRSAFRGRSGPADRSEDYGFRLARL